MIRGSPWDIGHFAYPAIGPSYLSRVWRNVLSKSAQHIPKSTGQESYLQRWGTWTPFFGRTVDGSNNPKQHAKKLTPTIEKHGWTRPKCHPTMLPKNPPLWALTAAHEQLSLLCRRLRGFLYFLLAHADTTIPSPPCYKGLRAAEAQLLIWWHPLCVFSASMLPRFQQKVWQPKRLSLVAIETGGRNTQKCDSTSNKTSQPRVLIIRVRLLKSFSKDSKSIFGDISFW